MKFRPDDPALVALLETARQRAKDAGADDDAAVRNWHFFLLYNEEVGVFGRRRGNPYAVSRREWIEMLVSIVDKRARAIPFVFNQSQRNLEAKILRQERRGKPARVVILKVRQNGISTYNLAVWLWAVLTKQNIATRIITDREELCETLLSRVKLMFGRLRMSDGSPWTLQADKSNRDMIVLGAPFNSRIQVVSANTPNPGFGETNLYVDMEETSKWPDAAEKGKGVELALPEVAGSLAVDVSQAKGNTGYFAEKFKRAWYRQLGMTPPDGEVYTTDDEVLSGAGWEAMFIPWFQHEEYRWTRIGSNPSALPSRIADQIQKTLTAEERVLLQQTFHVRGSAPRKVDYDQLAWRRYYIAEKCNGNVQTFHEQCPAFPEEALLASGRSAFNIEHVQLKTALYAKPPVLIGKVVEDGGYPRVLQDRHGAFSVWSFYDPSREYGIGVDTAAGVRGGDPCAACIIDLATREVVALWYGWEPPHLFGITVKRISDMYRATTAIETHPSQHGLAVYNAAEAAGCTRLFVQQHWDKREGTFQVKKGWVMSAQGSALVIDAVAVALADADVVIPAAKLLQELKDAQLDDKEKIDRRCRNDLIIAYGLALKLAELARTEKRAEPEPEKLPPTGSAEAFWRDRRQRRLDLETQEGQSRRYDILNGQGI